MLKIIIIGAGVVGQATGKGLIKKGHYVIFVDNKPSVINALKKQGFTAYLQDKLPHFYADISMFCIPTPYACGVTDLSQITSSVAAHGAWLKKGISSYHLIVIKSTLPPYTTRRKLLPLLELGSKLRVGKDIGLCMQPEFLRTKSAESDFLNPRVTVIGEYDSLSGDRLQELYSDFEGQIIRVDLETAEFTKYIHNCFNATKISFANEMWLLGRRLGIDANSALQVAVKSGEGFWNPGYGTLGGEPYNGSCLPKDVKAFLSFAKQYNSDMPVLRGADLVNSRMKKATIKSSRRRQNHKTGDNRLTDVSNGSLSLPAKNRTRSNILEKREILVARL